MHLQMADYLKDGFENRRVAPGTVRLRIYDGEKTLRFKRCDHACGFFERGVEERAGLGGVNRRNEAKLLIALADVLLIVDAVQYSLAQVAGKMQQQVGDGVFVISSATPHLLIGQPVEAARYLLLRKAHARGGEGQKIGGYRAVWHFAILRLLLTDEHR
jgi:hypothetical protein